MRRFALLATAASVLAGVLIAITGASANADDSSADVWGLRGSDRTINSGSCRYVTVTGYTNIASDDLMMIDTEVWHAGKHVGSVSLDVTSPGRLRGQYMHCPYEGLGRFTLGPSEVSVWTDDFDLTSHMDYSKGSFVAKQAARFTKVKASRKKSIVTIKSNPQYYATGFDGGWTPISQANTAKKHRNKTVFRLQRRNANGTGTWKTVKTSRAPKGKTLTFKVKTKKKAQYRIVFNETAYTFQSISRGVRR